MVSPRDRAVDVLNEHWNWNFRGLIPTCTGCGAPLDVGNWKPGMDVHPAMHRHQASLLDGAGLLPAGAQEMLDFGGGS